MAVLFLIQQMRCRCLFAVLCLFLAAFAVKGECKYVVVADSINAYTLPSASIFDCRGKLIGITDGNGRTPCISPESYPITVRYLGYKEKTIENWTNDTVLMSEQISELPELVIESRNQKVLHMLAYVREYSLLTNQYDTVFLFREKMVDYMLPSYPKKSFKGWRSPRILDAKSYYRFTNEKGLDSVSDRSAYHFSWSDWMSLPPSIALPPKLRSLDCGMDTLNGKYSRADNWIRNEGHVDVNVNVLADTAGRRWVPALSSFFCDNLEFDDFRIRYKFDNVIEDSVSSSELTGYSFTIESNSRDRSISKLKWKDLPSYISTYAEVYIMDREYITMKEARKWERYNFADSDIEIIVPAEAPALQPEICDLIARVNDIDAEGVRLNFTPDHRLGSMKKVKHHQGIAYRALTLLKDLTGISTLISNRNLKKNWSKFRKNNRSELEIERAE